MKANIYLRLLAVVIVTAFLAGCSAATKEDDKKGRLEKLKTEQADLVKEIKKLEAEIAKENPEAKSARAKDVGVQAVAPRKFDHYVQTQGHIESENNILVSAKMPGVVTQVMVTEGQQVSKGQVLAQIDNSVMVSNIQSMESQLELAKTVYERQEKLWAQKIGTEVQYLQAKTNKESLEKQLASLREQNEMYRIKAPITGTVDEIQAKVGQAVQPGLPAFRVVNASDLKLQADISEAYVTSVKKGNKVLINVPEIKKEIVGTVSFVGNNIDPMSRTFSVEVKLPSQADLRPNMSAIVKVIFSTADDAIVIPVNVIQTLNDEKIVYVAEKKGNVTVATKKVVTVEGVYNNQAQVQGLKAGDQVITVGYQGLNDGEAIKI
jgi:membrane fusion protein, multidrug efflux system